MDHRYLASFDGSEQAQGRGSGRDLTAEERQSARRIPATPYMQMAYAPMERRLDTAVFRALFASSARQARQFVIHGAVKVNGRKVITLTSTANDKAMLTLNQDDIPSISAQPRRHVPG